MCEPDAKLSSTGLKKVESPAHAGLSSSGGGIRTRDLRVMSPTSYLTAPPRGGRIRVVKLSVSVNAVRVAVIDIGTNTTRLLVAEPEDGDVVELERRTTITSLGRGVDADRKSTRLNSSHTATSRMPSSA